MTTKLMASRWTTSTKSNATNASIMNVIVIVDKDKKIVKANV